LKRVIQQRKEGKQVMLHRRSSTATDMKFPMYLVPLDQLERLYGGTEPRYDSIEAHQELLRREELVRWIDLPVDSVIIFMSHEHVLVFFSSITPRIARKSHSQIHAQTQMGRLVSSRSTRSPAQDISSSHETTSLGRHFSSRNERLPYLDVQDQSRRESRGMARYFEQSVRILNMLSSLVLT
jgi:hypothetical protein